MSNQFVISSTKERKKEKEKKKLKEWSSSTSTENLETLGYKQNNELCQQIEKT